MKLIFTLLFWYSLLAFSPLATFAQVTIEWDKSIEMSSYKTIKDMIPTEDGGLLIYGLSSTQTGSLDFWVIKTDANGQIQWEKYYGGNGTEDLNAAISTPDGGYLLAGFSWSDKGRDKTEDSYGIFDMWILKIDPLGNKEWDKTLGGSGQEMALGLSPASDGGYLVAGKSSSEISGNKTGELIGMDDYWVVKIDAAGKKLWDKTFGGTGRDEPTSIVSTPDGGFLIGGISESGVSADKTEASRGENDYWIVKIDGEGNRLWDKTYGGTQEDILVKILPAQGENYLLAGHSVSQASYDKTAERLGGYEYWILKIDAEGNKLWDRSYGGFSWERLGAATFTPDGAYLLGGQSSSLISEDKSENPVGRGDYWIIKINEEGSIIWDKTLGGTLEDELISLVITADEGIIAGGWSRSPVSGDKTVNASDDRDFWMIKFREGETPPSPGTTMVNIHWDKAYKGEDIRAMEPHPGKNQYLIAGNRLNLAENKLNDFWVATVDANGNLLWEKMYGSSASDLLLTAVSAPDGGFLLGGISGSDISGDKTEKSRGGSDFWIIKIDSEGNIEWDKTFGGDNRESLGSIINTPDGGFLLGGQSLSGANGDKTEDITGDKFGQGDFWVVKIDAEGNKEWDKSYGGTEDEAIFALSNTPDGGYLLGGFSYSGISGNKSTPNISWGNNDYWVVKIDESGNKQWDKTFGGTSYEIIHSILATPDGGFLLGGYSASPISGNRTTERRGEYDYWLIKIDGSGDKLWENAYGGDRYERFTTMIATRDNGFLLGGFSGSPISGEKSENLRGIHDYWVVKIDASGDKLWDKTIGGSEGEGVMALLQTDDGYLLGGTSTSPITGDKTETQQTAGYSHAWLVKLKIEDPAPVPTPGFITGGGWYISPSGAISADPTFEGRAIYSMVIRQKEQENRPTGNMSLTIPQANLRFQSTSLNWMHVEENMGIVRGSGRLNGRDNYTFLLSVLDGAMGHPEPSDNFRIIIWDKEDNIVYDNQRGYPLYAAAGMPIEKGNITIHLNNHHQISNANLPNKFLLNGLSDGFKAYPVPIGNEGLWIEIPASENPQPWQLSILDMQGRIVAETSFPLDNQESRLHWPLYSQHWQRGIYTLIIHSGQEKYQLKIIK